MTSFGKKKKILKDGREISLNLVFEKASRFRQHGLLNSSSFGGCWINSKDEKLRTH
jgi:hypothetical protein